MIMFNNLFNYNKIVYLEILNNTIKEYKNNILNHHYNIMVSNPDYYDVFYKVYNVKYFSLIKSFNYYYYNLTF